jgi:hypothetical protein
VRSGRFQTVVRSQIEWHAVQVSEGNREQSEAGLQAEIPHSKSVSNGLVAEGERDARPQVATYGSLDCQRQPLAAMPAEFVKQFASSSKR